MDRSLLVAGLLWLTGSPSLWAQTAPNSPANTLLDRMVGHWTMTGTVRGKPVGYRLDVSRVLQGRFVELHMVDLQQPPAYEARVFIGADTVPGRLIAHWLDNFGAAFSVPPATGDTRGDTLVLDFPYPTGAFRDTFIYSATEGSWRFLLDLAGEAGGWQPFAEYQVRPR